MNAVRIENARRSCGTRSWVRTRLVVSVLCLLTVIVFTSCNELDKPAPEPFFTQTSPPKKQEFRWSNGKLPKSFDPATASAPPETDIVRAVFEGLTLTDPKTLDETPGVAEKWMPSDDFKVWTFHLRKDARWTNGEPVTANDFVRSWTRLIAMGKKTAYNRLLANIAGVPDAGASVATSVITVDPLAETPPATSEPRSPVEQLARQTNTNSSGTQPAIPRTDANDSTAKVPPVKPVTQPLGIVAESARVLKVTLKTPDKDFPKLVANPIFSPVYNDGEGLDGKVLSDSMVSNGPFSVVSVDEAGIVLERSDTYWNRDTVKLERVHFVPMENAETALAAYRAGELDAVTNADFAPLVIKLLSPYDDFRRATHSALNFYDVNASKPPFSDRRVRQALSNAIEREKLTEGEMDGVTRPALEFLPYGSKTNITLSQDKEKAKELLTEAGFPDGKSFPVIRLVVNRNDMQQRVARSVAKMWKQNLNLETEIIVKEPDEVEAARNAGDFDLVRRGVVLPTADVTANFMAIFDLSPAAIAHEEPTSIEKKKDTALLNDEANTAIQVGSVPSDGEAARNDTALPGPILNEEDAIWELRAIPLYFPTSFSLVRPYVSGFEMNSLDALTLSNISIDNNWHPKDTNGGS